MAEQRRPKCPENSPLAEYMWNKRKEMSDSPKGISENVDFTLSKAYISVCESKNHITTLKEFSQIKGVGKWIMKLMQGFFKSDSGSSDNEGLIQKGKRNKGSKRYVPQKNSVAYALLITLYRETTNGSEFMRKQELIDAAEASGLSRAPIMPEKGKGKPGQFGSSPRDWYSGWSCMKILITKGMVVKSSCPAKYMLTEEGKEVARDCLLRSGLVDSTQTSSVVDQSNISEMACTRTDSMEETRLPNIGSSRPKKSVDIPPEYLDRGVRAGYSKEQVGRAFYEVSKASPNKEVSSLWVSVLCHLREEQVYGMPSKSKNVATEKSCAPLSSYSSCRYGLVDLTVENQMEIPSSDSASDIPSSPLFLNPLQSSSTLKACSSADHDVQKQGKDGPEAKSNVLATPPLTFGERFEDVYEVVLILDEREKYAAQGSRSGRIIKDIQTHYKIAIEVRRLPVGDCIWIARHKYHGSEYVLDFIVERKNVDDLRTSIRDSRYRDQKVRILRSGLKKMIYLVEGDPNACQASESIKTACFTTEILEGFDVQRTSGLGDTLRKYGYLTQAITQHYRNLDPEDSSKCNMVCPPYDEFVKRCQDLDKMTVSDVFAIQLMQVPQVTEDVAIAVLDLYPTLLSLARAYSLLDGDPCAQEEMLKKQSDNVISGPASRNIFKFIWGN